MPEPTPYRRPRAAWQALVIRGAALVGAGLLTLSTALPAAALGEDGPFPLPVATDTISLAPGTVTATPLEALLEDSLQGELELDTARLAVPEGLSASQRELMERGEDGRSLAVAGEGTWSVIDSELVFTPIGGFDGQPTPIAVTIAGEHETRSEPAVFEPQYLEIDETSVHSSAGEPSSVPLDAEVPENGSVRLDLDGLPAGSTLVSDGSRVTIPEQGVWQLAADGSTLTHTPVGPGLGHQPDPLRYVVLDGEGALVDAGRVSITVPIISDLYRSAPFGQDIVFAVGEGQQFVDPRTLRLEPLAAEEGIEVSDDGTEVTVPGQGVWTLDRDSATVRFAPESADVHVAAPMGITGTDGEGAAAAPALLDTAYPLLVDRAQAEAPGTEASFDLTTGIRDVRTDSLRFDEGAIPEGARLSSDGHELEVPGEGTWRLDLEARTATMIPAEDFTGTASPVGLIAEGVHADNPVRATLEATFSPVIATLRDDEERTAPGSAITVDVLGNDTAGSGSQPLQRDSVEIRSLSATNLTQLEDGRGRRLVIPDEGVYTVEENGAITFTPDQDFVGRATPIEYFVQDSEGIPTSAQLMVDVDPALASAQPRTEASGINSLLVGLLPSSPSTALVFGTIVMLLVFTGGVSLWIGNRMETDRRMWQD